jgi:hypothetical protein
MAGVVKLDSAKLDNSLGIIMKNMNEDVLNSVEELAALMKNTGDDNPLTEQVLEACVNFQNNYNSIREGVQEVVSDITNAYDVSEWLAKRATVGEVSKQDLSFSGSKLDASDVIQ